MRTVWHWLRLAVLLLGCLLNIATTSLARAIDSSNRSAGDRIYRETNDILYYDLCQSSGGGSGVPTGTGGGCGTNAADDKGNKDQVWGFLTDKFKSAGYSQDEAEKAAAGVMGNWTQETHVNSYLTNVGHGCDSPQTPGAPAYGIAQWCFGRIDKLKQYAASQGKDPTCLGTQLDYMWSEMQTGYKALLPAMKGKSPAEAAHLFNLGGSGAPGFEIGADDDKRQGYANKVYTEYTDKVAGPSLTPSDNQPAAAGNPTSSAASSANCDGDNDGTAATKNI